MRNRSLCRVQPIAVAILVLGGAQGAYATDNPVGHDSSVTRFSPRTGTGVQYRIKIKAGEDGNPATLPLPTDPESQGGTVAVGRDGGALRDPLTAGTWTGLGRPAGSGGWKYRNRDAPTGGSVSLLIVTPRAIRVVTKGTGTLPAPTAPNGTTQTVIVLDDQTYCAAAVPPYVRESDGAKVQSKDQPPPAACPPCLVGADTDGDRLDDCYETDTGVFVSLTDIGTDPFEDDTDGDSLNDGDELLGTTAGLDLPALGTNPLRKDILIEYDWFDDSLECGAHSHRPTATVASTVTAALAAGPVNNPDGSTGINVINDYGQGGVFDGGNLIYDADGVFMGDVNGAEFLAYKSANFASNRHGYFHYAILPHRYNFNSYSSGYAELFGDDMIVSLYCANSDWNVATTIVHELGHNLALMHGGSDSCNYKPNYNSVMNYLYQFPGIDTDCDPIGDGLLSYSVGDRIVLNEAHLDESKGTCGAPGWDWNGNSVIETDVSYNVNPFDPEEDVWCRGTLTELRDHNDWARLGFFGILGGDGAVPMLQRTIECTNPAPLDDN